MPGPSTPLPRPFPHPPRHGRGSALLLGAVLLTGGAAQAQSWRPWSGSQPVQPSQQPRPQQPQRPPAADGKWQAWQREQAQAFDRLSSGQRRSYFQERRAQERRQAEGRLSQLSQAERCFEQARGLQAVQACQQREQQARIEQRRQQMGELAQLRQRYGLPVPRDSGRERWSPDSRYPGLPQSSGRGNPYGPTNPYGAPNAYGPSTAFGAVRPYGPALPGDNSQAYGAGPSLADSWLELLFGL